jgi:hypothetical protein
MPACGRPWRRCSGRRCRTPAAAPAMQLGEWSVLAPWSTVRLHISQQGMPCQVQLMMLHVVWMLICAAAKSTGACSCAGASPQGAAALIVPPLTLLPPQQMPRAGSHWPPICSNLLQAGALAAGGFTGTTSTTAPLEGPMEEMQRPWVQDTWSTHTATHWRLSRGCRQAGDPDPPMQLACAGFMMAVVMLLHDAGGCLGTGWGQPVPRRVGAVGTFGVGGCACRHLHGAGWKQGYRPWLGCHPALVGAPSWRVTATYPVAAAADAACRVALGADLTIGAAGGDCSGWHGALAVDTLDLHTSRERGMYRRCHHSGLQLCNQGQHALPCPALPRQALQWCGARRGRHAL